LSIAVLVPVVWMVRVVETAAVPVGVTLAGLKLQLTPVGSPDPQLKLTAWLNPPAGVTVRTVVPALPCAMLSEDGFAATA
jgi:hypothetical protein